MLIRSRNLISLSTATLALLAGCTSQPAGVHQTSSADTIDDSDTPALVLPSADVRLQSNIGQGDIGQTFGVPDDSIPYPDTYWPFTQDGIDHRWSDGQSPLEKYMAVTSDGQTQAAKDWEHQNHGAALPGVGDWWGHCPGWTGAAMSNKPILHPVYAAASGDGGVRACDPAESGCVKFEIGDINALEAEIWVDGDSRFAGARCDTKPEDIARDKYGRIVRNGTGCKGLNAGALLVLLGNRMKAGQSAMAIDAQNDFNTDQIWNQPAYRYTVNRYEALDQTTAANLVASGQRTGDQTTYLWNPAARGWVFVDISILWVSEYGPNTSVVSGADSTNRTRFVAVIELDADPADAAANVIGGEYLNDASVGADRLTVPPFVWIAGEPGPDRDPTSAVGSSIHNPFVRASVVRQLIALGTTPAS